jgi:hypothetical protein
VSAHHISVFLYDYYLNLFVFFIIKRFPSTEESLLVRLIILISSRGLYQQTGGVTQLSVEAVIKSSLSGFI